MIAKLALLIGLYGGLSIAALLFVLIGFALAHSRAEVIGTALLTGALVLLHAVELYFLADLGRAWSGGGGRDDVLVLGGAALALLAGAATAAFLAIKLKRAPLSGGRK